MQWKSSKVQVIVAIKAFSMGIDKAHIRHIIRNSVPESIACWAQQLGRRGRDLEQAHAQSSNVRIWEHIISKQF